jgi:hypothetical protein
MVRLSFSNIPTPVRGAMGLAMISMLRFPLRSASSLTQSAAGGEKIDSEH